MAQLLRDAEIQAQVNGLSGWTGKESKLQTTGKFKDFIAATGFINLLVEPAESVGHHPNYRDFL